MELVCGLVLVLASVTAGSVYPGVLGVKTGAAAKAEATAVSGAFGGLPNPAVLSATGGGTYSSSFSKASSSSFASSSSGSSSYSFSGGFSGAIPGGTYNLGGAGCGSGEGCLHRAGITSGSGAYSGSIPIGAGLTGPGLANAGSGATPYSGLGATGIPATGSNYATAGSISNLFSGSKPTGPATSGIGQGYVGNTLGVYSSTAPTVNPFSVSSQNAQPSQNSSPSSQITSSVIPSLSSGADFATPAGTTFASGSELNSKHPTEANKGHCEGNCSNIGSKCEGTSCDSTYSKCTSSHCGSIPVSELSSAYNSNDIPVSVSNTIKHNSDFDDLPTNKNINKSPSINTNSGSKCSSTNCDSTSQPNSGNPYDGQYTSYNPKPNTADLSVYGGQPHKCSSPSCTQASQNGPNLSTQSEPQFVPLAPATHLTAPKEVPKETTKCDTPNCEQKIQSPGKNPANIPVAIRGSPPPHNIYPELTPSKGSPCGLANCDNQGNLHSSASGNALPSIPTYDHKASGMNCGLSGCGSSSYAPSGDSRFPSIPQGSPSSNAVPVNSYYHAKPQGIFPSGSVSGSSYYPSSPYGSTTPGYASTGAHFPAISQGLSPSKPTTGSSYFATNLPSTSPAGVSHFPLSPQGSTPSVHTPGMSYLASSSQIPLLSSSVPSGQGTIGCGQTGVCGSYPSSSVNAFGTAVTSDSHTKPVVVPDNKGPTYTGGFGAPAGFLKPNEYSLPTKPAYITPQPSFDKPSYSISPAATSQPSFVAGTSIPGIPSEQYNPSTQTTKPVVPIPIPGTQHIVGSGVGAIASAGASALVYTGGFGGPPGFLKPYDNGAKDASFPQYTGNTGSGVSGAKYNQGSSAAGNTPYSGLSSGSIPSFGGFLAKSGAIATAGAGVTAGTPNGYYGKQNSVGTNSALGVGTGHGDCTGGCASGSSGLSGGATFGSNGGLSKTGLFGGVAEGQSAAGASAKGFTNAVTGSGSGAFGAGGSFASSSAHASAGVGTKGGYGKR